MRLFIVIMMVGWTVACILRSVSPELLMLGHILFVLGLVLLRLDEIWGAGE